MKGGRGKGLGRSLPIGLLPARYGLMNRFGRNPCLHRSRHELIPPKKLGASSWPGGIREYLGRLLSGESRHTMA